MANLTNPNRVVTKDILKKHTDRTKRTFLTKQEGQGKVDKTTTVNGHPLSDDVTVTKGDVGLGNVDNTSDANKPISTATQTALNGKVDNTVEVNGHPLSSNVTITKEDIELGNVNNTSDANKPISTATQTALNNKVDKVSGSSLVEDSKVTAYDSHLENKNNPHEVDKDDVGLGNVDNTSDATKKTAFTGAIEENNTGFVKGEDVYSLKTSVEGRLTSIEGKIPGQASSENPLADVNFVNSSISNSTATFRGTYNVVTDLNLTTEATHAQVEAALATKMTALSITPDNNDYANVSYPGDNNATYFTKFERYKYVKSTTSWSFEEVLNNSTYTAAQWAAITSNITSGKVTSYDAHIATTTGNPHGVTKNDVGLGNVNNTSDADKPISTATQTALDAKLNKKTTTGKYVYTHDGLTQEEKHYDTEVYANYLVERDGSGHIKVPLTPEEDEHATSKAYADSLVTKGRTIEDLDISCPPITFGIAGGDAEISTGTQKLKVLYGNTTTGVQSAKLISRGKNQFVGFDDGNTLNKVVGGEEYKIFGLPSGFTITEYIDINKINLTTGGIDEDIENHGIFTLKEETNYISITPVNPSEVTEDTEIMLYITFGESYNEPYEEPHTDEIVLPNLILRSVGDVRDEIYSTGGGIRRISDQGAVLSTPVEITTVENPGWEEDIFIDNYGTLMFVDSNGDEIETEQPYSIIYEADLIEFLDSTYAKAKGNASDIALESDIEKGKVIAGLADGIHTNRVIDDLDISCPPVTYGIAGGDAEISTGIQELTKLFGNTVLDEDTSKYKSSKSAKIISRGKNQFTGFDEFIDVLSSEQYRIFTNLPSGVLLTEYGADKQYNNGWNEDHFSSDEVIDDWEESTRYIKLVPADPTEINDNTFVMMYNTFGESYDEDYEEPKVSEIELPNIELHSIGNVRDEIYAEGGGIRRVKLIELGELNWIETGSTQSFTIKSNDLKGIIKAPTHDALPNAVITPNTLPISITTFDVGKPDYQAPGGSLCVGEDGTVYYTPNNEHGEDISICIEDIEYFQLLFEINEEEITDQENPGWDPQIFIDNYGTLLFVDEDDEEVEVEQPYEILYHADLKEFLDSSFVRTEGNADDIALVSELENGDVVPMYATETETITPYGPNSGIDQRTEWLYQTTAGGSDCGSEATLQKIYGRTLYFNVRSTDSGDLLVDGDDVSDQYQNGMINVSQSGAIKTSDSFILNFYPTLQDRIDQEHSNYAHKYLIELEITHINSLFTDQTSWEDEDQETQYGKLKLDNKEIHSTGIYYLFGKTSQSVIPISFITDPEYDGSDSSIISFKYKIIDLTHCFGQHNEPGNISGIEEIIPFETFLDNLHENYLSLQVSKLITTGYNQNDEEYSEDIMIDTGDGEEETNVDWISSSNFLKVLPNTQYGIYEEGFTDPSDIYIIFFDKDYNYLDAIQGDEMPAYVTPSDACYAKLTFEKPEGNFKICLFIYWDGSKITYEPYEKHEYGITNETLCSIDEFKNELSPDGNLIYNVYYGAPFAIEDYIDDNQGTNARTYDDETGLYIFAIPINLFNLNINDNIKFKSFYPNELAIHVDYDNEQIVFTSTHDYDDMNWYNSYAYGLNNWDTENIGSFNGNLSINDFGTMEFIEENDMLVESKITYIGDYVAFIDSLSVKAQYDAEQIVLRTDSEIQEKHDDKNFIYSNEALIEGEPGEIIFVQHKHNNEGFIKKETTRQGGKRQAKWKEMWGTKFCNQIPNSYSKLKAQVYNGDITQLLDFCGFDYDEYGTCIHVAQEGGDIGYNLHPDICEYTKMYKYPHAICFIKSSSDFYLDSYDDSNYDPDEPIKYTMLSDYGNTPLEGSRIGGFEFPRFTPNYFENHLERFTFTPVQKRLFKFIKNFKWMGVSNNYYCGWTGVMANRGVEISFYNVIDWQNVYIYNIAIARVIELNGTHKYDEDIDDLMGFDFEIPNDPEGE